MFFKRGLAAILAAVTVVGLAGCGDSDKAADTDEATVKDGFVEKKVEPVNFDSGELCNTQNKRDCIYTL